MDTNLDMRLIISLKIVMTNMPGFYLVGRSFPSNLPGRIDNCVIVAVLLTDVEPSSAVDIQCSKEDRDNQPQLA